MDKLFFRIFIAACFVPCIALCASAPARAFAATIGPQDIVEFTNADRERLDLKALSVDPRLSLAAQEKADDMAAKGYFAHTSPSGESPWYWFQAAGYSYRYAGENLAVGFPDAASVEAAWLGSPPHRANVMSPNYTQIGVATAQGIYEGRAVIFVAEEFGSPSPAKSVPSGGK